MRTIAKIVTCIYCKGKFDREKVPFQKVSERRYAHLTCYTDAQNNKTKEEKDKEALEQYINEEMKLDVNNPKIRSQIKRFLEEYHYTYSGILNTLKYWYDVKKSDLAQANGGIGIVPYKYKEAYEYFYSLWLAQQKNANKELSQYIPTVIEVTIISPERKISKKKRFSFLDDEVNNE